MEANSKCYKLAKQYKEQEEQHPSDQQQADQQPEAPDADAVPMDAAAADDGADACVGAEAANGEAGEAASAGKAEAGAQPNGKAANGTDLAYEPSWARGGGGRGRAGGRFRGIDPIYPLEDPVILKVCDKRASGAGPAQHRLESWM
jgi:hypothetical protein